MGCFLGLWRHYLMAFVLLLFLPYSCVMCALCLSEQARFRFWQTLMQWEWQCRWRRSELRWALVIVVVIAFSLLFLGFLQARHVNEDLQEQLGQQRNSSQKHPDLMQKLESARKAQEHAERQADALREKYNSLTQCHWSPMKHQCLGLSYLSTVSNANDCKRVCCEMGQNICTTRQYQDSNGCWLGIPEQCNDDNGLWSGGQRTSWAEKDALRTSWSANHSI